jgi:membrane protease YdiL (CAAX protease family)
VCATPYRPVSEVIGPVIEPVLTESEEINRKVPNVWKVFWTFAIIILCVSLISYALSYDRGERIIYSLILGSVSIAIATVVFEIVFWKSLVVQLRRFNIFKAEIWIGLLILAMLLVVNYVFYLFVVYYYGPQKSSEMLLSDLKLGPAAMFILVCLLPGITEEIAFRGLIQHWLLTVLKPWRAILLTAALFTALHLTVLSAPYIFSLGILLGWVKWKSNSLYPCIFMHIIHNWVVIAIFPLLT